MAAIHHHQANRWYFQPRQHETCFNHQRGILSLELERNEREEGMVYHKIMGMSQENIDVLINQKVYEDI